MKPVQRKNHKKQKIGDCFNCTNCMYHSEGDSFCDYDAPVFIIEDWMPNENFMWCDGKYWEEQ